MLLSFDQVSLSQSMDREKAGSTLSNYPVPFACIGHFSDKRNCHIILKKDGNPPTAFIASALSTESSSLSASLSRMQTQRLFE